MMSFSVKNNLLTAKKNLNNCTTVFKKDVFVEINKTSYFT